MFRATASPIRRRSLLVALLVAATCCAIPTAATAANVTQTLNGWTVTMTGPDSTSDVLTNGTKTNIVAVGPNSKTPDVLTPTLDLDTLGCGGSAQTPTTAPCLPARSSLTRAQLIGRDGLLLQATNSKATPTIIAELSYGSSDCCTFLAGYWHASDGWSTQALNSGAMIPKITPTGRIAIGNPAFERLDWPFSRHQNLISWNRLIPGHGWRDVTTAKDHLSQIAIQQRNIRRWTPSGTRKDDIQSARAVIIAHETALGKTHAKTAAALLRSYAKNYGDTAKNTLTTALGHL